MALTQTLDMHPGSTPPMETDPLRRFRATHPVKRLMLAGASWEYIASGRGAETILILPGLLGVGEMGFQHILALEETYRVLAPSYPFSLTRVTPLLDGLALLLKAEGVRRAHVFGGAYGGMLAQRFVRRYPDRVATLILSHTGGPRPERAKANRRCLAMLRHLPIGLIRSLLRLAVRRSLQGLPERSRLWEAHASDIIERLTKADVISRYEIAVDFDANSVFTPDDLKDWPGRILILEGDDVSAEIASRQALKAFHPQAHVQTMRGAGHVASLVRPDDHMALVRRFLNAG